MPSPNCVGASNDPTASSSPPHFSAAQDGARRLLEGPQRYTCLAGGTRSGKTFLITRAIVDRALLAPGSRHAILRFRANAARASIAQDTLPTVMRRCFPSTAATYHRQDGTFSFANGSRIAIGGLDDAHRVERILGLEYASVFLNEASQIPYDSALIAWTRLAQMAPPLLQRGYVDLNPTNKSHWTNVLFGERRDPVTLQPLADPDAYARAFLNPRDNAANLSPAFLASLEALPERQRRRFYEGVYVDALDDALWTYEIIESTRAQQPLNVADRRHLVVAVDPGGGRGVQCDEHGIVVAALGWDGHAYVLADRSCQGNADAWAKRVVHAYHEFAADSVVAEINYGGDMVRATIHAADPNVSVKMVTATRGKAVRAEPISVRYAAGQVHHVERFPTLETQLCAFSAAGYTGQGSPDHADAAIWALTYLFELTTTAGIQVYYERLAKE